MAQEIKTLYIKPREPLRERTRVRAVTTSCATEPPAINPWQGSSTSTFAGSAAIRLSVRTGERILFGNFLDFASECRQVHDLFLGGFGPVQFTRNPPMTHDDDPVGQGQHFRQVTRDH
jgi:hypothetical protein